MARPPRRSTEKPPLWPEADGYNNDDDCLPSYEEATGNSGGDPTHVLGKDTDEKIKGTEEKACPHLSVSSCKLTLNPRRCCSCADKRPWNSSGQYAMYADGEGWVDRAARWQYYCSGCRGACVADSRWGRAGGNSFCLPSYEEATGNSGGDPKHVLGKDTDEKNKGTEEKVCPHWSVSGCKLTLNPRRCCSCADERPWNSSGRYAMYADGEGWVDRAARWQYYCSGCREYFDRDAEEKRARDHWMWEEKHARTLADARFFGLARYVRKDKEAAEGFLW